MVYPGFPRGGGAHSPGEGAPTYDLAKIFQKLHEIERIWIGGLGRVPCVLLDPPLIFIHTVLTDEQRAIYQSVRNHSHCTYW